MESNYIVYALIFPNQKRYIGLTGRNTKKRWGRGSGYQGQMVYNPIKKYGWENIEKDILKENLTKAKAAEWEEYYIKLYNTTNISFGYNKSEGGECGCHMSGENHWTYGIGRKEETKQKISNTLKGKYIGKKNPHHTEVIQKTLDGLIVKKWDCMLDIERELGFNHSHISQCCKQIRKIAYGFKWEYVIEKK